MILNRELRLSMLIAVATGTITRSSKSKPRDRPLGASTPTTRKRHGPTLTIWPRGLELPKSSRATVTPSTSSLPPRSGSPGERNLPEPTFARRTCLKPSVVPITGTERLRPMARTFSVPTATGAAPTTRGRRVRIAWKSSRVRSWVAPPYGMAPVVSILPGSTIRTLLPMLSNSRTT